MHRVRKSLQWVRQFFVPSIPYSFVVAESPENCLRKIEHKFYILSIETIEITSDEHGNSHFRIQVARTDPETLPSMIVTGKAESLDAGKTLVSGDIRSSILWYLMFMVVGFVVVVVAGLGNNDSKAIAFGLIGIPFAIYTNVMYRKHAYLWLTSTLQYVLES